MSRHRNVAASPPADLAGLFPVSLGALAALLLPYVVSSTASDDALRDSKLVVQALGAALVLLGLARGPAAGAGSADAGLWPRLARLSLLGAVGLTALSAAVHAAGVFDPLTIVAIGAPLVLVAAGASGHGETIARRAFPGLMVLGAASGLLAASQRLLGGRLFPVQGIDKRFLASALIGNPGDVGAALVIPALLLWMAMLDEGASARSRLAAAAGLGGTLVGLGATEAIGPLLAIAAGLVVHLVFDPRRRAPYVAAALALALGAAAVTGIGPRALEKIRYLRVGRIADASTQRDIGVLAALEMMRKRPLLGVGPGAYENAFVPARLAAERRVRRRLVHLSESAHFENAHSEPLTVAAECGLPAAGLAGLFVAALLAGLVASRHPPSDSLAALVAAMAVLLLGSFPLRIPVAAGPAAFVAGLALRRIGGVPGAGAPGPRRALALRAAAALLAGLGLVRGASVWLQAKGEDALRGAASSEGPERVELLARARRDLTAAVRLRPRRASPRVALGSIDRLEGDLDGAWDRTVSSFALEERAETDLNLGRIALARRDAGEAHELFRRAVWILPRLLDAVPDEGDPAGLEAEVSALGAKLPAGGEPPALPARLAAMSGF